VYSRIALGILLLSGWSFAVADEAESAVEKRMVNERCCLAVDSTPKVVIYNYRGEKVGTPSLYPCIYFWPDSDLVSLACAATYVGGKPLYLDSLEVLVGDASFRFPGRKSMRRTLGTWSGAEYIECCSWSCRKHVGGTSGGVQAVLRLARATCDLPDRTEFEARIGNALRRGIDIQGQEDEGPDIRARLIGSEGIHGHWMSNEERSAWRSLGYYYLHFEDRPR